MASHANVDPGNAPALANGAVRSKGSTSWIGKIMGGLLNVGGNIASRFGGGWGKVIGTGMQLAGGMINKTDNLTGGVA